MFDGTALFLGGTKAIGVIIWSTTFKKKNHTDSLREMKTEVSLKTVNVIRYNSSGNYTYTYIHTHACVYTHTIHMHAMYLLFLRSSV